MFAVARLLINNKLSLCFNKNIVESKKIMLTRKRAYSGAVMKKFYSGEVFKAANSFPPGELPTNKQVIE